MSTVYVCPERDIECGRNPASWCATCPQRAASPVQGAGGGASGEAPYRVYEFWSSSSPGTKVRMLAEGGDIEAWPKRRDFIRDVTAERAPAVQQVAGQTVQKMKFDHHPSLSKAVKSASEDIARFKAKATPAAQEGAFSAAERAVAWAVTAERGGIHKLSITKESAERKAAKWREEWPDNGCRVRPLVFGDTHPASSEAQAAPNDKAAAQAVPEGWKIERNGDTITIGHDSIGRAVTHRQDSDPADVVLYHLAEHFLAAAPKVPAQTKEGQ